MAYTRTPSRLAAQVVTSDGRTAQEALDELDSEKANANQTPTIEELLAGGFIVNPTASATISYTVLHAHFALTVVSFSLVNQDANMAASDTDYWTINLRKISAGSATTIASKTTKATGGQAVTLAVPWTFDAVVFSNNTFAKDDVLNIEFVKTGAATNWTRCSWSARYQPV